MKYRIKQIGDRFYPQKREWFIWRDIEKCTLFGCFDVWFDTMNEAIDFIKSVSPKKETIHKLDVWKAIENKVYLSNKG